MSAKNLTGTLTGSFVALITPFNKDGWVDFESFHPLLKLSKYEKIIKAANIKLD